jgi:hypothetical protein
VKVNPFGSAFTLISAGCIRPFFQLYISVTLVSRYGAIVVAGPTSGG